MADFTVALKAEIQELENELKNDPRYTKLESLRSVLLLYQPSGVEPQKSSDSPTRTVTRAPSEGRAKAIELARLYLKNRSGPTPTRDIFDHIINNGAEIGGKDPVNNLSAMLSNSDEFQSNGRAGWTLAPENGQAPIDNETYEAVAEAVLADLTSDQMRETHSWVVATHKVPQDIDGKLLGVARDKIGRFLAEKESVTLRSIFSTLLASQINT